MSTLGELTNSFKPVETKDFQVFYNYYSVFFETRKYPRFYQSILEMSQYVNVPLYFWGIIDDCLVVVHKRHIHVPVFYLIWPPISRENNHSKEMGIIELFRNNGCHTRMSEEDMMVFGISKDEVNKNKYNYEFVYLANELKEMPGGKWKNIRYKVNKFKSLIEKGDVRVEYLREMNYGVFLKCKLIYDIWLKEKRKMSIHSAHKVLQGCPKDIENLITIIYNRDGGIVAWGASECVSVAKIVQTTRFRNYQDDIFIDPSTMIHYYECLYWIDVFPGKDVLCNFGSGVFPDLIEHKKRLKPVINLQLWDLKVDKRVDKKNWDFACVSWKKEKRLKKGFIF